MTARFCCTSKRGDAGNIFIYLIGAIFLMGILIMLLKGSFQEGVSADSDKVVLQTSEVQRYAGELERGVNYIIRNGYSEADIRFAHADAPAAYGATTTPGRQVFDSAGGAVEYKLPPSNIIAAGGKWQFSATTHIQDVGSDGATRKAELLAVLPSVTKPFCERVNMVNQQAINLGNVSDTDPCLFIAGTSEFVGIYTDGAASNEIVAGEFSKTPAKEACVKCQDNKYYYYRVLLTR